VGASRHLYRVKQGGADSTASVGAAGGIVRRQSPDRRVAAFAPRRDGCVGAGPAASGARLCGVLEQSWRINGATAGNTRATALLRARLCPDNRRMSEQQMAVVVVTYESGSTIDACLQRLRAATEVAQIRVVDNASRDDTLAIVQRHALEDRRVRFVANPDNPGFATACNQGAAASDAPWLAFVNPDLLVEADTLALLRAQVAALGDALLGVEQVDEHGRPDAAVRRRDPDFAAMLRHPLAGSRLALAADPAQPLQRVDAISGALMLLPRALFERIGGWDAGYRLHAEDLDLCRRARQAGAVVAVCNDLRVLHVRGVSSRKRPWFVEWHKHRGLWRYFRKFEAPSRPLPVRAAVWAVIWLHAWVTFARLCVRRPG